MFMHRRERVEPVPASVPGSTVADIVERVPLPSREGDAAARRTANHVARRSLV